MISVRTPRIKIAPELGDASYHCITRTVNGEFLFDDVAKEVFRKQMRQVSEFCGLHIFDYTILSNHIHILTRVPKKTELSDAELLRRYRVLYPRPTGHQTARIEVIEQWLATQHPHGVAWRQRMMALMGDVSPFMQLLKQRFSIWFNRNHNRYGTLWSQRFTSVLAESVQPVLLRMAPYIDLNCVRAQLVGDPKDYRFCAYGEAVAGGREAQEGLCSLFGDNDWTRVQAAYRQILFSVGSDPRHKGATISQADFRRVIAEGGQLPLAEVLRCRVRYFTQGAVLGTRAFVEEQLAAYRRKSGRRLAGAPYPLPPVTDWGELVSLRLPRGPAIG